MERHSSTMQVTRAADYGIRVMIYMATLSAKERVLLPALASATSAPESFLSKVLQALCHAGFIASRRGQTGGFELLPAGRKASIRSVIEAVEGPICLNLCLSAGASCKRKSFCPAHPVWASAQEAMLKVLDTATVADLALQSAAPPPRASRAKSKAA
ncbi:MAG: RrF2 family transcriptional regulator [Terracidiphilus sp.]